MPDGEAVTPRAAVFERPLEVGATALTEHLFGRAAQAELDERGCFSRESCGNLEARLLAHIAPGVRRFATAHQPGSATYLDRWRYGSCLQKAIRFCLPEVARHAANQLYAADPAYALRRLGMIAVEDVMAGAPVLVAGVLAAMGDSRWRAEMDERRLVVYLADALARVPKDRSALELHVMVDHDETLDVRSLVSMREEDLAGVVGGDGPILERQAAAQILAGPSFGSDRMPKSSPYTPGNLFRLLPELGMTRWSMYVAAKTATRLRDSMWVSLPIIDRWMSSSRLEVIDGPSFPTMVGDVLGAAYDKYTRQGGRSIAAFAHEPSIAALLATVTPAQRRYALGVWVFVGEGGTLAHRAVTHPESEYVHRWARSSGRMFWMPRDLARDAVPTVRANLGRLNEIRGDVLRSGTP